MLIKTPQVIIFSAYDNEMFEGEIEADGSVFTVIVPDAKTNTLMPIIQEQVKPDSIVYTDTWRSYNALDVSEFKHYRINHSQLFVNKRNHINGIENFWKQANRHMRKFNGVPKEQFHLFLKECEWRFNNNPKIQLKQLNQWVKEGMGWLSRTAPNILINV